jgi:hypothetical protein
MRWILVALPFIFLFALCAKQSHADVRRWNKEQEKVREAVSRIDMGDFAGPAGENGNGHQLFHWVLACVDGVKVYTTTLEKKGGIHSVILPGKCNGTYAKPTAPSLPQNITKEEAQEPSAPGWKSW